MHHLKNLNCHDWSHRIIKSMEPTNHFYLVILHFKGSGYIKKTSEWQDKSMLCSSEKRKCYNYLVKFKLTQWFSAVSQLQYVLCLLSCPDGPGFNFTWFFLMIKFLLIPMTWFFVELVKWQQLYTHQICHFYNLKFSKGFYYGQKPSRSDIYVTGSNLHYYCSFFANDFFLTTLWFPFNIHRFYMDAYILNLASAS